jgi:hypothetical protein
MRFATCLRGLAGALVGLVVLSACTVVDEPGPGPWPGPGPNPGYCTREYEPVCARRDGERRTFSNACLADRAGYQVIRRGECRRDGGGSNGGDEPRFCTREYRPVCARRDGRLRTFGNACEADAAGWRVVGNGEC